MAERTVKGTLYLRYCPLPYSRYGGADLFGFKWLCSERNLMECRGAFPARVELLNALDEQIHIITTKTFASFTDDERREFKTRQQRIRDLAQALAFAQAEQLYDHGVFAGIYK